MDAEARELHSHDTVQWGVKLIAIQLRGLSMTQPNGRMTRARRRPPALTAAMVGLALGSQSGPAWSEMLQQVTGGAETGRRDNVIDGVIVTGAQNMAGVLQKRDGSAALGIEKPLVETPRSVTSVSELLLDRYNIKSVYDLTAVAAGTYTGSFFGIPGSLNIRGALADTYFNGFQQITNYSIYRTPVDASSSIDLVRGPPSPAYGAGQIGGFMNFSPKSVHGADATYLARAKGAMSATIGSYNQREATLEGGAPFALGARKAGVYGYLSLVDSGSFYRGRHPKDQTAQLTFNTELSGNWALSATAQYLNSDGYLKNIGWNRVTQALIDESEYVSGRALAPIAQPGAAFITPAAFSAAATQAPGGIQQYVLPGFGILGIANDYTRLDPTTVKRVKLSPRDTLISPVDINRARTPIFYLGVTGAVVGSGTLKLESFSQHLEALNYLSVGFATEVRTTVNEERLTYNDKRSIGDNLVLQSMVGVSFRYARAKTFAYLNSGVTSQDRWDLSKPQTADDIFNAVFATKDRDGYRWDNAVDSRQSNLALFGMADAMFFDRLGVTAGIRSDNYALKSNDTGTLGTNGGTSSDHPGTTSYEISVSLKTPYAVPYATYARSHSLNFDTGGAIAPGFIASGNAIGTSTLRELGVKTSQLNGRFYASADIYRQTNQYVDVRNKAVDSREGEGFEAELRYLATESLGMTGVLTYSRIRQRASGDGAGPFLVITPEQAGIAGVDGYGGMFVTNAGFIGLGDGYELHTTPRLSGSLFATYDRRGAWGLTGGVTYNSWTGGSIPGSIRLPAYLLARAGAYAMIKGARIDLYVDNLFDRRYFIAEYDVDANASVLPGLGREIHLKLSTRF